MDPKAPENQPKIRAVVLYAEGMSTRYIAREVGVARSTLMAWKRADDPCDWELAREKAWTAAAVITASGEAETEATRKLRREVKAISIPRVPAHAKPLPEGEILVRLAAPNITGDPWTDAQLAAARARTAQSHYALGEILKAHYIECLVDVDEETGEVRLRRTLDAKRLNALKSASVILERATKGQRQALAMPTEMVGIQETPPDQGGTGAGPLSASLASLGFEDATKIAALGSLLAKKLGRRNTEDDG